MTGEALPAVKRNGKIAFYALVALFCLLLIVFTGFLIPILPGLFVGWFDRDLFGIHQVHEMGYSARSWAILIGMLLQLRRPEQQIAALQMVILLLLGDSVVSLATGTFSAPSILFLLFPVVAAWLHPRRGEMLSFDRPRNPELLLLTAVALVPVFLYAAGQVNLQMTTPATDEHAGFAHYTGMVNLVSAPLLLGLLAGLGTTGWRVPAWAAGLLAAVFGLLSLVFPEQTSSAGSFWAILALVWGVVFIAVAEWKRRAVES